MTQDAVQWHLEATQGRKLAMLKREATPAGAKAPGLFWLGGFRSDMTGTKAEALDALGQSLGLSVTRFDYSGHGQSEGAFIDGTIGQWFADALSVFLAETSGPQIVVGSSMGGWIALLLARALKERGQSDRLRAMVLIAPAPDFTEALMVPAFSEALRTELMAKGVIHLPSAYGEPTPITRALIEDGRAHGLLDGPVFTGCPVHILQGMMDVDVPYTHAMRLMTHLAGEDALMTLVKDGDHRLSRPEDLIRQDNAIRSFLA